MRSSLLLVLVLLSALFVVVAAGGCETTRSARPEQLLEPVPLSSERAAQGQVLFMRYCHTCHPDGGAGLGTSLLAPIPDPVTRAQIRVGGGGMPRFSTEVLQDEEVDAILLYLDTLRDYLK